MSALAMAQTGTANPLVCVDEVDKASRRTLHGDPIVAMLSLIEPGSAAACWDWCLLTHVDISNVNWLCTANELDPLPAPLRSRLDIVEVAGPSIEHFDALLKQLQGGLARSRNMPAGMLPELADEARKLLRNRFARHRSVRRLRRELEATLGAAIRYDHRQMN